MGAYSKHSINAHCPHVATVSLNLRMGPLKGFPSPTWCQTSKTAGRVRDSHPSSCLCWISHHLPGAPHICGSPSELLGPGQGALPSLPPAPSTFQSFTNRRKPAEQFIFMNRNSIGGGDSSGLGRGEEEEEARTKGPLCHLPAGNRHSPRGGRSRLYCVNPFACRELLCAFPASACASACAGRAGAAGGGPARSPPRAPPTALIGC